MNAVTAFLVPLHQQGGERIGLGCKAKARVSQREEPLSPIYSNEGAILTWCCTGAAILHWTSAWPTCICVSDLIAGLVQIAASAHVHHCARQLCQPCTGLDLPAQGHAKGVLKAGRGIMGQYHGQRQDTAIGLHPNPEWVVLNQSAPGSVDLRLLFCRRRFEQTHMAGWHLPQGKG